MLRKAVSGLMLSMLLVGLFTLAFNIQPVSATPETIYIRADGSVNPAAVPLWWDFGYVYTFIGNISETIVVQRDNIIIDGMGYSLNGTLSGSGIDLSGRTNVTVKNVRINSFQAGILLVSSQGNTIIGNNLTGNLLGIVLYYDSFNNFISGNIIASSDQDGILLLGASNNTVIGNNLADNSYGVGVDASSNNTIVGNNLANNENGIILDNSSNNTIVGNNVANSYSYGMWILSSSDNKIYHNNFLDNTEQVFSNNSTNLWDDGYPSGGNYWSDYTGVDANKDGIGDTSYTIDVTNQDHYPLMEQFVIPEFPSAILLPLFMILSMLTAIFIKKRPTRKAEI